MNSFRSRTPLFLMEIILALFLFSIAAMVCIQIFVTSHLNIKASSSLTFAVSEAQTLSELFTGSSNPEDALSLYSDSIQRLGKDTYRQYYDVQYAPVDFASNPAYYMDIKLSQNNKLETLNLSFIQRFQEQELYTLEVQKAVAIQ